MVEERLKPNRKRWVLLTLLALITVVGAAEVAARLTPSAGGERMHTIESDPDLIWRLKSIPDDTRQATNELGLRDTPYRPEAQVRLLLLGDSVAYGDGVGAATGCFPYLLERELEQVRKRTHEIVNSACVGWGTAQQTRYLELYGLKLKPRAVILQDRLNDVLHPYRGPDQPQGFFGVDTRHGVQGLHGSLLRGSEAYAWVARRRRTRAPVVSEEEVRRLTRSPLPPDLEAAWEESERELDRLAAVCKQNGLPLLVVVTPYRFQLDDPQGLRAPQARLRTWAERSGAHLIDLLPKLARVRKLMLRELFFDADHLSETGHRVTGAALGKPIAAWLDGLDG